MNVYFRKQINKQAATCMTQRVYLHINLFVNIVYTLFVFLYICSNYNYVVMKRDTHGTGDRGEREEGYTIMQLKCTHIQAGLNCAYSILLNILWQFISKMTLVTFQ